MLFTHNTFNRNKTVLNTFNKEKFYFSNGKYILVYNSNIETSDIKKENINCYYIGENKGHKLGSINCVYSALKIAYDKADDNELIIFSHDDIFLYDINLFNKAISLAEKHGFVGRRYIGTKHTNVDYYLMMESFIITKENIPKVIKGYSDNIINDIPLDKNGSPCPEMYFGKDILDNIKNPYLFDIKNNEYSLNKMGYFHINNIRGWSD